MSAAPPKVDRAQFEEQWRVFALRVPPTLCNSVRAALKPHCLRAPRVQSVVKQPLGMLILLRYLAAVPVDARAGAEASPRGNLDGGLVDAGREGVSSVISNAEIPGKCAENVVQFVRGVKEECMEESVVHVTYDQWPVDAVLRALIPAEVTIPTSFETVGHIAHLNLREEHTPYKQLIGQVMVDKLKPRIRTVVNKLQSTGGPYRTFAMEVLAGDPSLETQLRENGCTYHLDFSKVYWNSRLETEHRRIIESLKPDDVLADAFAGIGPFALPAARQKRCRKVYGNDLNPSSVEYLRRNAKANGLSEERLTTSCSCAREFIKRLVREEAVPITRVVMNFPSGAPEFLDVFRGLYRGLEAKGMPMPRVHCYCFVKGADNVHEARNRARHALFGGVAAEIAESLNVLPDSDIDVREVRDVAPRKVQVCVTFQVPRSVAYAELVSDASEDASVVPVAKMATEALAEVEVESVPATKRQKLIL